MFSFIVGQWT